MKVLKGLGRAFWTILFVVIAFIAIIVFLTCGPQFTVSAGTEINGAFTGLITIFTLGAFTYIFGGETTVTTTAYVYFNGSQSGDPATAETTYTLNFDYFSLISLILIGAALIIFLVFYSKKTMLAISAFLFLGACVLSALYSVTFPVVNADFCNTLDSATLVPTGAIVFSVGSGLLFILTLIKTAFTKK